MIDGQVAYDKLAQFKTASEIADYFESLGIKAVRADATACAITVFMRQTTENEHWNTAHVGIFNTADHARKGQAMFNLTPAMLEFVETFDEGGYPYLVDPDAIRFEDSIYCCADCDEKVND